MHIKSTTFSYENRARTFWTLVFLSIAFLVVYVLAVNATVRNTVVRENLEEQGLNLSAVIGELEFTHIALKNGISLDLAHARGFRDVVSPIYVSRTVSHTLSLNTDNR